jgi:hypothetical protein
MTTTTMTKTQVKRTIDTAFVALQRACESSSEADRLLTRALDAARTGERKHRTMGRGLDGYSQSIETAARYFVIKWFCEPGDVTDALQATRLREDCLCASALRFLMGSEGPGMRDAWLAMQACASIDYTVHIVR